MQNDSLIHLRVPAATKGRWVRASRAAGMRLTDWIVNAVEQHMPQAVKVTIPEGVNFADLHLARDPATGAVSFDWTPIERICEASGIDVATLRHAPEDRVAGMIVTWYEHHRAAGGARDAVQEDLIAETVAENRRGGGVSHHPGRA